MKTVAIIQARMGSTRLPGKVLLPIGESNAIQMIVDKCNAHQLIDEVVIATTENEKDKQIQTYCIENDIEFYVGSEENVLERVYKAAKEYRADIVIDITADCPFIDLSDLNAYIPPISFNIYDYVSNVVDRTFPDGLDLQVYGFKALKNLETMLSDSNSYRQHAGWNFTRFPDHFKTLNVHAEGDLNWPELRITLDTAEDYAVITLINSWIGRDATPTQIVDFMKKNPSVLRINQAVIAKEPGEL